MTGCKSSAVSGVHIKCLVEGWDKPPRGPTTLHYTHLYTTSMLECVKMKVIFLQEGGQLLKLHYISALGNALNVSLNTIREEKFWAHNIFKTNGFIHKLASFLQPPSWFP